jgi:hypothetical protein
MKHVFGLSPLNDESQESMAMVRDCWPHRVACVNPLGDGVSPAHQFCVDRYGPCASVVEWAKDKGQAPERVTLDTDLTWVNTGRCFYFRNADQAFEFKLAWGQPDYDS